MSNFKTTQTEKICHRCGSPFRVQPKRAVTAKYCSRSCHFGTVADHFWDKVKKGEGDSCWVWLKATDKYGYGVLGTKGKLRKTHRISWEIANGDIPSGMCVCHKCDNRLCVRPSHLFIGSNLDNIMDRTKKGRGAPQNGENNPSSKLTATDVDSIFAMRSSGMPQSSIAYHLGVSQTLVSLILRGVRWANR